jgi:glycosyltransferase involved in cell wall biosynthesis
MNAFAFHGAEHVITISDGMAETLREHTSQKESLKISIIENFVDTEFYTPISKSENPIVREFHLEDKFIIAYAGSFGATYGVERIVQCAEVLKECSEIHFLLIGKGTEQQKIQQSVQEKALTNLTILPFQPTEKFRYIAAATDLSVVLLRSGIGKTLMPSKLYTALSAGSAILAVAEPESDLAHAVKRHGYGVVVPPGDIHAMAARIFDLAKDPDGLAKLQKNARDAALSSYSKSVQCEKYVELFSDTH